MAVRDWDSTQPTILPTVPRLELTTLAHLDSETRFHLTMYLKGAAESDQEEARRRCAGYGVDFNRAREELRDVEYRKSREAAQAKTDA